MAPFGVLLAVVLLLALSCTRLPRAQDVPPPPGPAPFLPAEVELWALAMQEARRHNVTLRVFYHTSTWQRYWRDVIAEQLLLLDGRRPANFFTGEHPYDQGAECRDCPAYGGLRWLPTQWASVLDLADQLYLNVAHQRAGDFEAVKALVDELPLRHRDKLALHFNLTVERHANQLRPANASGLSVGEVSTVTAMQDHCIRERLAGRTSFVLYLHSKGACCSRTAPPTGGAPWRLKRHSNLQEQASVSSWRELMNTFNIEFPSICLRALLEGYVMCGANLLWYPTKPPFEPHYAGSVYWARCDHLAALPALEDPFNAWQTETWPFKVSLHYQNKALFAFNCAFNAHRCHENMYRKPCRRASYRDKVRAYLRHWRLPTSDVATRDTTPAWVLEHCHPLMHQPYYNQPAALNSSNKTDHPRFHPCGSNASFWANLSAFPFQATKPADWDRGLPARFNTSDGGFP